MKNMPRLASAIARYGNIVFEAKRSMIVWLTGHNELTDYVSKKEVIENENFARWKLWGFAHGH